MERASTRRFPSKLVAAHLGAVTAGALHAYTLAWMLGVDGAELEAELTPDSALVDIDILEFDLGLRGDSLS